MTPQSLFSLVAPRLATRRCLETPTAVLRSCQSSPASRLDGFTAATVAAIAVLEEYTLRRDLSSLTMMAFRSVLSSMSLVRTNRAWCPVCYDGQRRRENAVVAPLLWSLDIVVVCPLHRIRLEDHCPRCARQTQGLHMRATAGHCPWCLVWLGRPKTQNERHRRRLDDEIILGCKRAELVGRLLAAAPAVAESFDRAHFPATIAALIEQCAEGSRRGFARGLGRATAAVQHWHNASRTPRLDNLVAVCLALELDPVDALSKTTLARDEVAALFAIECRRGRRDLHRSPPLDRVLVEAGLQRIADAADTPPSLSAAATSLGCTRAYLIRNFGELCTRIEERRRRMRDAERESSTTRASGPVSRRRDPRAAAPMLEKLLVTEPPPSVDDVATLCGWHKYTLYDYHGELMRSLARRHAIFRRSRIPNLIWPVLEAALVDEPPPSMVDVSLRLAKLLGCRETTTAWVHYPETCKAISARHATAARRAAHERRAAVEAEIRGVIDELEREGKEATFCRIFLRLRKHSTHTFLENRLITLVLGELARDTKTSSAHC